jgi:hypothetical protein
VRKRRIRDPEGKWKDRNTTRTRRLSPSREKNRSVKTEYVLFEDGKFRLRVKWDYKARYRGPNIWVMVRKCS